MNLPRKRPWLILVFIYLAIIGLWTTITILAKENRKDKQGIKKTEEFIHEQSSKHNDSP